MSQNDAVQVLNRLDLCGAINAKTNQSQFTLTLINYINTQRSSDGKIDDKINGITNIFYTFTQ